MQVKKANKICVHDYFYNDRNHDKRKRIMMDLRQNTTPHIYLLLLKLFQNERKAPKSH